MILDRDRRREVFEGLNWKVVWPLILIGILSFIFHGCTMAPIKGAEIEPERLVDGVYEGSYRHGPNSVVVEVTVSQGRIVDIELVKHFASWKGDKANDLIPQRIIAEQSTDVDSVSGATNSSRVIMNAVQNALEKAYR